MPRISVCGLGLRAAASLLSRRAEIHQQLLGLVVDRLMSGGSFNYLSVWAGDITEIAQRRGDLGDMADQLESTFPGSKAARDTRAIYNQLCQDPHEPSLALGDVWHSVEWWQSGDSGKDSAQCAVDAYQTRTIDKPRLMNWIPS